MSLVLPAQEESSLMDINKKRKKCVHLQLVRKALFFCLANNTNWWEAVELKILPGNSKLGSSKVNYFLTASLVTQGYI